MGRENNNIAYYTVVSNMFNTILKQNGLDPILEKLIITILHFEI